MPIMDVNLQGGLNTEADEQLVGFQGFTQLRNLEQDTSGQLRQRLGFLLSSSGYSEDRALSSIKNIVDSRLTNSYKDPSGALLNAAYTGTAWVICARQDGGNDFHVLLCDPATFGNNITLQTLTGAQLHHSVITDYGNGFVRIGLDIDTTPTVLQYIDRNFFWGVLTYDNRWYYDTTNYPRLDAPYIQTIGNISSLGGGLGAQSGIAGAPFMGFNTFDYVEYLNHSGDDNHATIGVTTDTDGYNVVGLDLSSTTYYYKIAPIFDGIQEGLMGKHSFDNTTKMGGGTKVPKISFDFDYSGSNWNPRLTGFNLYRSTSEQGTYNKIMDISAKEDDPNLLKTTDGKFGDRFYVEGANWTTNEHAGRYLLINTFATKILSNTADTLDLIDAPNNGDDNLIQTPDFRATTGWAFGGGWSHDTTATFQNITTDNGENHKAKYSGSTDDSELVATLSASMADDTDYICEFDVRADPLQLTFKDAADNTLLAKATYAVGIHQVLLPVTVASSATLKILADEDGDEAFLYYLMLWKKHGDILNETPNRLCPANVHYAQICGDNRTSLNYNINYGNIGSYRAAPKTRYDGIVGGTVYMNYQFADSGVTTGSPRNYIGSQDGVWSIVGHEELLATAMDHGQHFEFATDNNEWHSEGQRMDDNVTSGTGNLRSMTESDQKGTLFDWDGSGCFASHGGEPGSATNASTLTFPHVSNISFTGGQWYTFQAVVCPLGTSDGTSVEGDDGWGKWNIYLNNTTGLSVMNPASGQQSLVTDKDHYVYSQWIDNTDHSSNDPEVNEGWGHDPIFFGHHNDLATQLSQAGFRSYGWRFIQLTFKYATTQNAKFVFNVGATSSSGVASQNYLYFSGMSLRKMYYTNQKNIWGGEKCTSTTGFQKGHGVMVSPDFNFADGELDGCAVIVGTGNYPQETDFRSYICGTGKRALNIIGLHTLGRTSTAWKLWVNKDYIWYKLTDENKARLEIYDRGNPLGVTHPLAGSTSLDTKYKYSKTLNGRNFVANVRITSGLETEDHTDWVMYSEVNQPDVIPISNYIQLEDMQGGDIVGLEVLMSDLVVFMERGIFRLSVTGTDTSGWSLIEAYPNIGCLNHLGILKTDLGIIFCSASGVYLIDTSFALKPLHMPIKSQYESKNSRLGSSSELVGTTLGWNEKDKKLYVLYAITKSQLANVYDFKTETWSELQSYLAGPTYFNQVVQNHELTPYFYLTTDDGTSGGFYKQDSTSTEAITTIMETGTQKISDDPTRKANIRKAVVDATNPQHASEPITMTVSGGNSIGGATIKSTTMTTGVKKARIGRRSEAVKINLQRTTATDENYEINRVALETD